MVNQSAVASEAGAARRLAVYDPVRRRTMRFDAASRAMSLTRFQVSGMVCRSSGLVPSYSAKCIRGL